MRGVTIWAVTGTLLIGDVFYNLGLTSIDDAGNDVKNRVFSATVGLAFPLG